MKLRPPELYGLCGVRDTLNHFFYYCAKLNQLWTKVETMLHMLLGHRLRINWEIALFGILALENVPQNKIQKINLIILLAKLSISKSKYDSKIDPHIIFESEVTIRNLQL